MTTARDFLGRGWRFPPTLDGARGRIALVAHEEDVKQALRIILGTSPRERAMRPEFGCGVHDLVFESLDATTLGRVETAVREALRRWEPRIDLIDVDVSVADALEGKLTVLIEYALRTVNRRDNLVYDFYLRGNA